MTRTCSRLILAALLCLSVAGCASKDQQTPSGLRTISMTIGAKPFTLEVADNEFSRDKGLMERDSMPADHGMIFVFDDEQPRQFWMKNTRIPLDILFLDHAGKIVSTATMKPFDLSTTSSAGPAQYAIELNVGQITETGVQAGQVISLPPLSPAAAGR